MMIDFFLHLNRLMNTHAVTVNSLSPAVIDVKSSLLSITISYKAVLSSLSDTLVVFAAKPQMI